MNRAAFRQTVSHFDRARINPWMALRNALGLALSLIIGAAAGNPGGGLLMAVGALYVSYSDGRDPYTRRARRMFLASLLCPLAVFTGGISGHLHWLAILEACLCAFAAGMMVAVTVTAADLGNITLIALVVFSAKDLSSRRALTSALLVFAGGLLQTALALAFWRVRRYAPERRALAALYTSLARSAAAGAPPTEAPPASAETSNAHTALDNLAGDWSLEAERYLALLSQAERIRLALLALARLRVRLPEESRSVARTLVLASEVLATVGAAMESVVPAKAHPDHAAELSALAEQLRARESMPPVQDARRQMEALAGQLRSALELAGHVTAAGELEFRRREAAHPWRLRLGGAVALLRANLEWNSAAFRHAVRLAVCVVLATFAGRLIDWRHSYWLPMTAALILRPDFSQTFSRGVLRLAGTLAGLVLATALFASLAPGLAAKIALIAVFAFLLRCYGPANYGLLVTALTALLVLLFAMVGEPPEAVILARGLNTLTGGLIALTAYWVWPTWERTQIPETLAALLDAYRAYIRAVGDAYLHPETPAAARLDRARQAARLARSNLEAAAIRLHAEPGTAPSRLAALEGILASSHRFIHAGMSLEAGLVATLPAPARDGFRVFATHVDLTLYYLAASLRGSSIAARDLPDLREDHHALAASGVPGVERYALVNVETDRLTNSLNTLAGEILSWEV